MSSETVVQQRTRLLMAQLNAQLWRNNSGAYQDERGNFIRYGLCNDSAQLNAEIKSSDLIGCTPVIIQPRHVGMTLGVFTALEVKPTGWKLRPSDKRGLAQEKFHTIVKNVGGFAGFVTDPHDVFRIIAT